MVVEFTFSEIEIQIRVTHLLNRHFHSILNSLGCFGFPKKPEEGFLELLTTAQVVSRCKCLH